MTKKCKIVTGQPYKAHQLNLDDEAGLVWGVYVGGCIDERVAWSIWDGIHAHAHNQKTDPWFGWICIVKETDVVTKSGMPSQTLLHEYAHLLVPNQGHTAKWKRVVTELGAGKEVERALKYRNKAKSV